MDSLSAADMKQKIGGDVVATLGVFLLNIGKQTGLWEAFRGCGRYTTAELADRSGLSQRYLEEWCRAAVLHGYLGYEVSGEAEDVSRQWDSGMPVRGTERFYIR